MDIKAMLVKLAEEQAERMQEEALKHLASDEFTINKRVNLPWINEEKEQELFEKLVDVMTDMLEGVFKGK